MLNLRQHGWALRRLSLLGIAILGPGCSQPAPSNSSLPASPAPAVQPVATQAPVVTGNSVETSISLENDNGTFVVPVTINGAIELKFTIDSGASDVSIPSDVASTLVRTGTITRDDFIGDKTFALADGSIVPSAEFRIRTLKVGTIVLHDVVASLAGPKGSLLLGQTFLSRMATWSIDNGRHVLVLKAAPGQAEQMASGANAVASQSAQTPTSDDGPLLSEADLTRIASEFNHTMGHTGMAGVSALLEDCYRSIYKLAGPPARHRAAYCVTMDLVGLDVDTGFRRSMEAQTSRPTPPAPYYEDAAWKGRLSTYLPLISADGSMPDADIIRGYANSADKRLAQILDTGAHQD